MATQHLFAGATTATAAWLCIVALAAPLRHAAGDGPRESQAPDTLRASPTAPPASQPALAQRVQMLREAFELLDDGDEVAALRALQRLVDNAPPETLAHLEEVTHLARRQPLLELMADLRMRAALAPRGSQLFDLRNVTDYEAPAIARRLSELLDTVLAVEYRGRSIRQWAADREEYTRLFADAADMVRDAEFAAALIRARLRFDPALRQERVARRDLTLLRDNLGRFVGAVRNMPGFTGLTANPLDPSDPTFQEAARRAAQRRAEASAANPDSAPASRPNQPDSAPVGTEPP